MAWNFAKEIRSLTGYVADDTSGVPISGDSSGGGSDDLFYSDHTTQWLTDGAKEVITYMSPELLADCVTIAELNNSTTSLTSVADTYYRIVSVTRKDGIRYRQAREIPGIEGGFTATDGRASDPDDLLYYGTKSDPVYWKYNDTLFVYPVPTATELAKVQHISFPTVAYGDTAIANFPAEAERLVVLYAAIKALQYQLSEIYNGDENPFDDVQDSINDGVAEAASATGSLGDAAENYSGAKTILDTISWDAEGDTGGYDYTDIIAAISTITGKITELGTLNLAASEGPLSDAANMLDRIGTPNDDNTGGYLESEDTELANTAISTAQGYIAEASTTVSEFSANVSAINSALQAAQAASSTASTYIQSKIAEVGSLVQIAGGYVSAAQGNLATAQTYFQEAQTLTQYHTTRYNWYKDQMQLLTADYARGVASISGKPLPQGGERRRSAE